MDTHELAWAAGFFDGEGSTVRMNGKYARMQLAQSESGIGTLRRFRRAVGAGSVVGPNKYKSSIGKPQYVWVCSNLEDCQFVLARLWKWLGLQKRGQASTVFSCNVN